MQVSDRISDIVQGSDGWGIFYRARELKDAGHDVIELTVGQHDISTDPIILEAMYNSAMAGHTGYANLPGTNELRDKVAERNGLMPQISRALGSFHAAMTELGCVDDVVTFTASDFARTLGTNGKGSDHAWGGQQLVMGGGIDGGKIFGDFPHSLTSPIDPTNGNLDLGRGRLIPTTSVDELAAELAMWFGVDNASDLSLVLPNIGSFYSYNAGSPPLGIFS